MFTRPLRLKTERKHLVLIYGKQVLCKINKDGLSAFLSDLRRDDVQLVAHEEIGKPKEKKKKKPVVKVLDRRQIMAGQLAKAYAEMKKSAYRVDKVSEVKHGDYRFKHFIGAVEIMQRHKCKNYRTFLLAQVEGLKFLNGGKGFFPKPQQLDNEQAETRLLDYLAATKDDGGNVVRVELSDEDKNTPLTANMRYLTRRDRVKNGIATLDETVYVKLCQLQRRGKVDDYVTQYLNHISG